MGVVLSLEDRVRMRIAQERLLARLLSAFALLAILLSAVGLYGVIAWAVTARTREIGVRIALGARRSAILHMVVRHSAILFMVGTVLGLAGAFALVRVLESRLFGIDTLDAASYLAAVLVFTATSALAITAPTRNALRVDPLEALRSE
jgi:putative ABC transport system permease protein